MTTDAVVAPEKLPFLSRIWHGILLGFLIGATNFVFTSPSFKGNIGEFEFAFSYFSYTTVYWLIGGVMDFMRTRYPKPRVLAGTVFYFFLVSVLAGSIVARLMFLFPGGAGLFHPTHGSNLANP